MKLLVDTNLLCRAIDVDHVQHPVAKAAMETLRTQGHELISVPQVIYEWWNVATRPKEQNGQGLPTLMAGALLAILEKEFPVQLDSSALFSRWRQLVLQHDVKGKNTHDARLAAAGMLAGVDALLTFNGGDFKRFGLTVLDPLVVAQAAGSP